MEIIIAVKAIIAIEISVMIEIMISLWIVIDNRIEGIEKNRRRTDLRKEYKKMINDNNRVLLM